VGEFVNTKMNTLNVATVSMRSFRWHYVFECMLNGREERKQKTGSEE
jgi:hypothetical protein